MERCLEIDFEQIFWSFFSSTSLTFSHFEFFLEFFDVEEFSFDAFFEDFSSFEDF